MSQVTDGCDKCGIDPHRTGKCPALGKGRFKCGGKDHFGNPPACPGKKTPKLTKPTKKKEEKKKSKKDTSSKDDAKKKKKKTKRGTICYLIQPKDKSSTDEDKDEEEDGDSETSGRILHKEKVGQYKARKSSYKKDNLVDIRVTPSMGTKSVNIKWFPDCGVKKTLVAEKHFRYVAKANPNLILRENTIKFRPYSTNEEVPIIGKCKATLRNLALGDHKTNFRLRGFLSSK